MSLNELSKHSCISLKEEYRTKDINEVLKKVENDKFSLVITDEQEKREYFEVMQKRRQFEAKVKSVWEPKDKYLNYLQKRVLKTDITPEMQEKEEQWGIDYADYLHDLK